MLNGQNQKDKSGFATKLLPFVEKKSLNESKRPDTVTTPGALKVINEASERYGEEVLFGAGTVLDAETARAAILAGAGFIVAPTLNFEMVALCKRYCIPVIRGAIHPLKC